MSRFEAALITRILDTGEIREVRKVVTSDHFFAVECRSAWNYLVSFFAQHGTTPSREVFQAAVPRFTFAALSDPVAVLAERVHEHFIYNEQQKFVERIADLAKASPLEAAQYIVDAGMRFRTLVGGLQASTGVDITTKVKEERDEYYRRKNLKGILGIPWPWPRLNRSTFGIQDGQFIVFYARPKNMKCVVEGERILTRSGERVPIEALPADCEVPSFTLDSGKLRWASARRVESGMKDCVEVATRSGLRLRTSTEHLYMVPGYSFKRICDLRVGDTVATCSVLPECEPTSELTAEDAHFLGMLIGDGNFTRNELQFTTADDDLFKQLDVHATRWGCYVNEGSRSIEYRVVGEGKGHPNVVLQWLRRLELHGLTSPAKFAPTDVFTARPASIAAFLAGLVDMDGTVSTTGSGAVVVTTASPRLAGDVQHLFARLGVRAAVHRVDTNFDTVAYQVAMTGAANFQMLWAKLGPHMCLERKKQLLSALADRTPRRLASKRRKRDRLRAGGDRGTDLYWDRIVSIKPVGFRKCYDICIKDGRDPNFLVEGLVVHNTWLLLKTMSHCHYGHGRKPLIFTREMTEPELRRRFCALFAGIDYQRYLEGNLSTADEQRWEEAMDAFEEQKPVIIDSVPSSRAEAADEMIAKAQEYGADIIGVDGVYFYGEEEWDGIAAFTRRMKYHLLNTWKVPCIGTTQGNRSFSMSKAGKKSMDDVGRGDSIAQDVDLMIKVAYVEEDERVYVAVPGIREGKRCEFQIWAKPAFNFEQAFAEEQDSEEERGEVKEVIG